MCGHAVGGKHNIFLKVTLLICVYNPDELNLMQGKSLLQYRLKKEAYFNVADSKNALASNTVLVTATNSECTLTSRWHRLR